MNDQDVKKAIEAALKTFLKQPLAEAALHLFKVLGYASQRRLKLSPNNLDTFIATFDQGKTLNDRYALPGEWKSSDFLFQLTDDEIRAAGNQHLRSESKGTYNGAIFNSYLFFTLELQGHHYTRTALAGITRELNKLFDKPVLVLFRHGETLTLAIINRRPHKRDEGKYVLDKVTLIKDIGLASTHRAHTKVLFALSLAQLQTTQPCDVAITDFVTLHNAWQKTLDIQTLNKRFFIEIRNWFYWARLHANFPDGAKKDADNRDSEALIRLLTRMIFCWFLREKKLIPENFFVARTAESLLRDWFAKDCDRDTQGRFYKAILQNLFFATLGTAVEERQFRSARSYQGKNKHYGDQRYFRHLDLFIDKAPVEDLYKSIPFLNGGLFENLDEIPVRDRDFAKEIRVDGFPDIASKQPTVPDFLFFGDERPVPELSALLGATAAPKARGLLHIFRDYKNSLSKKIPRLRKTSPSIPSCSDALLKTYLPPSILRRAPLPQVHRIILHTAGNRSLHGRGSTLAASMHRPEYGSSDEARS
jgi:adenine-specific DNA-methyltransferase